MKVTTTRGFNSFLRSGSTVHSSEPAPQAVPMCLWSTWSMTGFLEKRVPITGNGKFVHTSCTLRTNSIHGIGMPFCFRSIVEKNTFNEDFWWFRLGPNSDALRTPICCMFAMLNHGGFKWQFCGHVGLWVPSKYINWYQMVRYYLALGGECTTNEF